LPPAELLAQAKSLDPEDRLRLIAAVWGSLPAWHPAAPTPGKQTELQSCLDDYDDKRTTRFPWEVVQGLMAGESRTTPAKIYSVPRRFDLATIFVVTLAYSLLLGTMKAIGFPPIASAIIAGFISIVGAAQAFLFGGKQPRTASIVAGALTYALAIAAAWIASGPRIYGTSELLVSASFTIAGGGFLGYLAGVFIGGVFLVADKLRNRFSRRKVELND
jgi:putative addiction module component (TIGR02574 family)